MPATIHAVLAARLDRLDSAELAIVKAAAVIGKSFSDEAALLLAGRRDPSELESHLGALVRKQIIEADGGRFGGQDVQLQAHPPARRGLPGHPQGAARRSS